MLRTVLALCPACASASRLRWAFVLRRKTLDEGADVNALDEYGQTALRLAAESCNQKDVIKALLERGAEVSIRDINGLTAVDRRPPFFDVAAKRRRRKKACRRS